MGTSLKLCIHIFSGNCCTHQRHSQECCRWQASPEPTALCWDPHCTCNCHTSILWVQLRFTLIGYSLCTVKDFVITGVILLMLTADVNFASELSDLRHRHGFQVILVHGNHTSSALLQHAHCHVAFQEITADLPPRMLVKAQVGPKNASLGFKYYFLICIK